MQQWIAQIAYDSPAGPKQMTETFFLPTVDDVRKEVSRRGQYVISIHPYERSPMERVMAKSSWWQVQLLRGIQFRSIATSPGVALWKLISAEINPRRQNILAPAREALTQGLGVIDALKALRIFDSSTIAILAASEKANKLVEGIPYAIESIVQKRKNMRQIMGTVGWLGFDVFSLLSSMIGGKGMIMGWFSNNAPKGDPAKLEEFNRVTGYLSLTWDVLIWLAIGLAAMMIWIILSFWYNRGRDDEWPTAKFVRSIPLIGAYLRDLAFADTMSAAARMIRGNVPIADALPQAAVATNLPEVQKFWIDSYEFLARGLHLGAALDREPLSRSERMELSSLSELSQIATIMESIAEMRSQAAKTKHSLIVWLAFAFTGLYLLIGFGSAIYALMVMNISLDSMISSVTGQSV